MAFMSGERKQLARLLRAPNPTSPERAEQWASQCITLGFARRIQLLLAAEYRAKSEIIIDECRLQFHQLAQHYGLLGSLTN